MKAAGWTVGSAEEDGPEPAVSDGEVSLQPLCSSRSQEESVKSVSQFKNIYISLLRG